VLESKIEGATMLNLNKKIKLFFTCKIILLAFGTGVSLANNFFHHNQSETINQINTSLKRNCIPKLNSELGVKLGRSERPRTLILPFGFYVPQSYRLEIDRILRFINILELKEDIEFAAKWMKEIDRLFYLQFRKFVATRRAVDPMTKNKVFSVLDRWYDSENLNNRLLTKTIIEIFCIRSCSWTDAEKLDSATLLLEQKRKLFFENLEANENCRDVNCKILSLEDINIFIETLKGISIDLKKPLPWKKIAKVAAFLGVGVFTCFWLIPKLKEVFANAGKKAAVIAKEASEKLGQDVKDALADTAKNPLAKLSEDIHEIGESVGGKIDAVVGKVVEMKDDIIYEVDDLKDDIKDGYEKVSKDVGEGISKFKKNIVSDVAGGAVNKTLEMGKDMAHFYGVRVPKKVIGAITGKTDEEVEKKAEEVWKEVTWRNVNKKAGELQELGKKKLEEKREDLLEYWKKEEQSQDQAFEDFKGVLKEGKDFVGENTKYYLNRAGEGISYGWNGFTNLPSIGKKLLKGAGSWGKSKLFKGEKKEKEKKE
jgi:hypothetical protein